MNNQVLGLRFKLLASGLLSLGILTMVCLGLAVYFFRYDQVEVGQDSLKEKSSIVGLMSLDKDRSFYKRVSIPYWDQKRAYADFLTMADIVDQAAFFWFFMNEDGDIVAYEYANTDQALLDQVKELGVETGLVITNLPEKGDWDSQRVEAVITDENRKSAHIQNIVDLANDLQVDWINIDYESLDTNLRDEYSTFIEDLSQALHSSKKKLGVALHPRTRRFGYTGLGKYQDWTKLSRLADHLYLMAYGEHWDGSRPGPIASLDWVEANLKYARSQSVDFSKLIVGVPLYGYDWGEDGQANGLTYQEAVEVASLSSSLINWSDHKQAPFFTYQKEGERREVWFEDERSLRSKIDLAFESGVGGVFFWRLGGGGDWLSGVLKDFD